VKSVLFALADHKKLLSRDDLLDAAERALAEAGQADGWEQVAHENWIYFQRPDRPIPRQGWKLHVSATPDSAAGVLSAVLPVLFRAGCWFKMVRSRHLLRFLNEAHSQRGAAGKFITVYPDGDAQAVELAQACHEATLGLAGPVILSDRRYRPDSLVHYRYGSFVPQTVYNSEGQIVHVIRDPEGRPVPDAREAWFSPPAWVSDPFAAAEEAAETPAAAPGAVLLDGRWQVTQALRHANKGGVYLGTEQQTGAVAVIKEARPHVGVDRLGRDARDCLRAEARNLEMLRATGVAPEPLRLFEQGGHLFLAIEKLEGTNLREWRRRTTGPLPEREVLEMAGAIAGVLDACHQAGMLVRDFTPNNLMVLPGGELRLVDLEMACREGDAEPIAIGGFTPGYTSGQQRRGELPSRSDDHLSLGAVLFLLATGRDPLLVADSPAVRTRRERLGEQYARMADAGLVPHALRAPIEAALSEDPAQRWSAARVREHVVRAVATPVPAPAAVRRPPVRQASTPRQALAVARDLAGFAAASIDPERPRRPVDGGCGSLIFDPCSLQYGAAGVGLFLASALDLVDDAGRDRLAWLARWTRDTLRRPAERPQGLYFGCAGSAWFLLDAAEALGDAELREAACRLALTLRPLPRLADVTHGSSGIGMTLLHFHEVTGRPEFLEGAHRLAEQVAAAARVQGGQTLWPQPDAAGRETAFYGFAHGTAGIAYFLLAAHGATGDPGLLTCARAAVDTLVEVAEVHDGCAYWAHGPTRATRWTYWCNGSSGVGGTLLRAHLALGDERCLELAGQAAEAVFRDRWHSTLGQCHGLAGNGEFLLDMHQLLGDARYLEMAREMAEVLYTHRICRDGQVRFANDSLLEVSPEYGVGTSGVGAFYRRLATGAPRLLMVDGSIAGAADRAGRLALEEVGA
jgi:rhamnogalacturonyl hydrolase YesR